MGGGRSSDNVSGAEKACSLQICQHLLIFDLVGAWALIPFYVNIMHLNMSAFLTIEQLSKRSVQVTLYRQLGYGPGVASPQSLPPPSSKLAGPPLVINQVIVQGYPLSSVFCYVHSGTRRLPQSPS